MKHLIILFFSFVLSYVTVAANSISISFVGPDSLHIKYNAENYSDTVYFGVEQDGQPFTAIQPVNGSGSYRYVPTLNSSYSFKLCTNAGIYWATLASTSHYFQGDRIYGYMYFDESIDLDATLMLLGNVTVPQGILLSLKKCELDANWTGNNFLVSGIIEVTKNVKYSDNKVNYILHSPQALDGCIYSNFHFKDGSSGSTFINGSNVALYAYTDIDISNIKTDHPFICGDEATVTAYDCEFNNILATGYCANVELNSSIIIDSCVVATNAILSVDNSIFPNYGSLILKDSATFNCQDSYVKTLNINAPDGTCIMSDSSNKVLNVASLKNGQFNSCSFYGDHSVSPESNSAVTFNLCKFYNPVGVSRAPVHYTYCDFGYDVNVYTPCAANFSDCQFLEKLIINFPNSTPDLPVIENNSFLYKNAITINCDSSLTNVPVVIGRNYYGDPTGSGLIPGSRGGTILSDGIVQVDALPLKKGIERSLDGMPIRLWSYFDYYGQGTLPSAPHNYNLQGRETAYVVDVGINRNKQSGIEFRAELGGFPSGQYIYPTRGSSITLQRDYSNFSDTKQKMALNTVNFILPPIYTNSSWVLVYYKLPGMTNFNWLTGSGLDFNEQYKREFMMNIVPVKLHAFGYPGGSPKPSQLKKDFQNELSAKFAMPLNNINLYYSRSPYNYYGLFASVSLTYLLNEIALEISSGRALIKCCDLISGKTVLTDFTVIQFADNVLLNSGVDGASVAINRKLLFTDGNTDALLHELGHALGMYRSDEQYDLYPKYGLRDVGFTAFVTEPVSLPGFLGEKIKGQRRLRHFPSSNLYWYTEENSFDIMGGKPKNAIANFWPVQDTAYRFYYWFDNLLNRSAQNVALSSSVQSGNRRIYVTGKAARTGSGEHIYNYLLPWSIDVMEITDYSSEIEPGPYSSHISDFKYLFEGFDSTGGCVYSEYFYSGVDYTYVGLTFVGSYWYRSFDVPENTVKYTITDKQANWPVSDFYNQIIWESAAGGNLSVNITSPASGDVISDDFSLSWNASSALKQNNGTQVQSPRYMVWASTDEGSTWEPQSYMITENKLDFSYDSSPAGTNLILRVIASDGFSSKSETISDFTVVPPPPSVTISQPFPDSYGTTGTLWNLEATVFHPDSDTNLTVEWYSSLDGFLGNTISTSCYLTSGSHSIICKVIDSAAKLASSTVNVEVTPEVNYQISSNNLWICSGNFGLYAGDCVSILTNVPLNVGFNMRAPGGSSYIKAELTMKTPDNVTTVIGTTSITNIDEFSCLNGNVDVMPTQWGNYTFSVELTELIPQDSVPGGTSYSITFSTVSPPEISSSNDGIIDFGYQAADTLPTGLVAYVYNTGGQDLQFGTIAVGGQYAFAFSIENDLISQTTLSPGQTGTVKIVFETAFVGHNQAYLELPCNDLSRKGFALNLSGDYLMPEPGIIWIIGLLILFIKGNNR